MMMRTICLTIACLVMVASAGQVQGVQWGVITLEFSGIITTNSDFSGPVQFGVGTTFSGYITYDVSNAEFVGFQESNPGNTAGYAESDSGCVQYVNGLCVDSRGSDTPVVVDYEFVWVGGVVKPWEYSLDFQDASRRVNLFDVPPARFTGEGWSVNRNQFRQELVGDPDPDNYDYTATTARRFFTVGAFSNDDALLSGPIDDFSQGFNPEVLFSNGVSSINLADFVSVETSVSQGSTTTVYNAGSYQLGGLLTSASFRPVVPEPTSLAIWGAFGGMGLIAAYRRRKRTA